MFNRFQFVMSPEGGDGGNSGGSTPPPASPPPAAPPSPPSNDFRSQLGEFANDDTFKTFNDVQTLAKSYKHAASMVGRDKVVVPTSKSSPEEFKQYYQKIGLPESRDKYEVKIEGLKDESKKALLDMAYEKNLLPSQVEPLVNFFLEQEKTQQAAQVEAYKTEVANTIKELKAEYGEAFESKVKTAKAVAGKLGGEEFLKYIDESGLGNDKNFIKFMINMSDKVRKEDTFNDDVNSRFNTTKEDASKEINKIMGDLNGPYYNRDHAQHKDMVARIAQLHEIASQK